MRCVLIFLACFWGLGVVSGCNDGGGDGDGDGDADGDADTGCDPDACEAACLADGELGGACVEDLCECHGDPGGPWVPSHGDDDIVLEWDPECLAGEPADLLEGLFTAAGLEGIDDFGYTEESWAAGGYTARPPYGVLADDALLSWFYDVLHQPLRVPCFASGLAATLDGGADAGTPVSSAIALGAWVTDLPVLPLDAPPPPASGEQPLSEAVATFITLAGDEPDREEIEEQAAAVPLEVQRVVAPVIRAMGPVFAARAAWVDPDALDMSPGRLFLNVLGYGMAPGSADFTNETLMDFFHGDHAGRERREIYQAAYDLAVTIEAADWASIEGIDTTFSVPTPAGLIVIGGPGDDTYTEEEGLETDLGERVALMVELGGDDVYRIPAGATGSELNLVSVHIDLGGQDRYGYDEVGCPNDTAYLLPSDSVTSRYRGDTNTGPISFSTVARQGAGILGVGLLFDLGDDNDHYQSLRVSQGMGFLGVGVLYDAGGDDTYLAEASSQGAAYWGIGAFLDAGAGTDIHELYHQGQGFGYVTGAGMLWDGGGDDEYLADIGDPDLGGHPIYASAQRPGTGNSSFTGGAGFGRRADADGVFLSGGLGLLRDRGDGADVYTASVFGLGTGYWQGTGLLMDDGGDDSYDALWYIMGGAAHYALGALFDRAGNDTYNELRGTVGVNQGSGHDYSLGLLWDGAGDDWHYGSSLGMGTGNCNGLGLYVDLAGNDTYVSNTGGSYGMARTSGECEGESARRGSPTMGFFVDCGGADDYSEVPDGTGTEGTIVRDDDTLWLFTGTSTYDLEQYGGGVDDTGGCGVTLP